MNRRIFLQTSATGAAIFVASPSLLFIEGCTTSITELLNTVLDSTTAILLVAEPGATWVVQFQNAVAALKQAEAAWQGGSTVQLVIDALNTLEAVTAVIPVTEQYSPLIAVLVAGIEAVLDAIFASTPVTPTATLVRATPKANPYRGKVVLTKPHFLQTRVGAYKKQWNAAVVAAGLSKAAELK